MNSDVSSLGNEYLKSALDDKDLLPNPYDQFSKWFDEAVASDEREPNAMILGTVDESDQPHQRTVLLKGYDSEGFVFYTNYHSHKGQQIESNSDVSLLFPMYFLQRQIIICGSAKKVSREESRAYFHTRPRESQIGAYVSNQSAEISSREELENSYKQAEEKFKDQEIPLPDSWGGYRVTPRSFEFWQGRASRLHDRIFYELTGGDWRRSRLSP